MTDSLPGWSGARRMNRWKGKLGGACEYYIILAIIEDAQRVPPCKWEYPTLMSASELQKLFEIMGLVHVIVK